MIVDDEAVEIAAKAIFDVRDDPYDLDEWEDNDSVAREPYLCQARAAINALGAAGLLRAPQAARQESCPTRLMDGRNEIRCWLIAGHEGECI